jgi:paraquat-inducible protein A
MNNIENTVKPLYRNTEKSTIFISLMLALAVICNIAALITPFIIVSQVLKVSKVLTLPGSVLMMWNDGLYFVAVLIFFFSLLFPFVKLGVLSYIWFFCRSDKFRRKLIYYIEPLGKWSMLDVFVICIILVLTNKQILVASESQIGVYLFLIAIFLSIICALRIEVLTLQKDNTEDDKRHTIIKLAKMDYFDRGIVATLFLISLTSFVLAVNVPFLKITDLFMSDKSYSIFTSFVYLWNKSPVLMIFVLFTLIICPLFHILGLAIIWLGNLRANYYFKIEKVVHIISKFDMLDVFWLSLLLFMTEGKWLIATERQFGLTMLVVFLFSTFLIPIALKGTHKKFIKLAEKLKA